VSAALPALQTAEGTPVKLSVAKPRKSTTTADFQYSLGGYHDVPVSFRPPPISPANQISTGKQPLTSGGKLSLYN